MLVKPLRILAVLGIVFGIAHPALADDATPPDLKTEIDAMIHRLEGAMQGIVKWDGAEKFDVRQDGKASVADIRNARISFHPPADKADKSKPQAAPAKAADVVIDHIELRRAPGPDNSLDYTITGPGGAVLHVDDQELKFTLTDHKSHFVTDAKTQQAREAGSSMAGMRMDDAKNGNWATVGPSSSSYKLDVASDGSWKTPTKIELTKFEFFGAKGPAGGTLDRILITGQASGPDAAALARMRDKITALQQADMTPDQRGEAILKLFPEIFAVYGLGQAEISLEGLAVRAASVPLVTMARASFGMQFTGLAKDTASLRLTLKHDGLKLDQSIPNSDKIPSSAQIDIGLEDVSSGPLRTVLDLATKMKGASPEEQQKLTGQMMGAAATLTPALRLHDLAFETADVGLDAKAEAKGSPLSPKGYSAGGDVSVRGLNAVPKLAPVPQLADYVALLSVLGTTGNGVDGKPATKFHLVSAPPKWIEINGNDVSGWFTGNPPNGPRRLRLADPAMTGDDVRAVQRALAAKKVEGAPAAPTGTYDGATAAAVARFQKQAGLNVDGTVDANTRDKLGAASAGGPAAPNSSGPSAGTPKVAPANPSVVPRVSPAMPGR